MRKICVRRLTPLMILSCFILCSIPVLADGTEMLDVPSITIQNGTGIVVAGTGLADSQPQIIDITITDPIVQVLLYWSGQSVDPFPTDDTIEINGTPLQGTLIGGPTDYGSAPWRVRTYRRDITADALVSLGANSLTVEGLDFNFANDGAGILVIMDDGGDVADLQLRDGTDFVYHGFSDPLDRSEPQTFTFLANPDERTANLSYFVTSVDDDTEDNEPLRPTSIEISIDGGAPTLHSNVLYSADGKYWDALSIPFVVPAGATSLTTQIFSRDDLATGNNPASLTWITAAFELAVPPFCGDSEIDTGLGETCDPPFAPAGNNGNDCRDDCTVCGDGVMNGAEQCDDGNGVDNDSCRNNCTVPVCGDGLVDLQLGETCDPPFSPAGNNGNDCRDDCTVCGDGEPNGTEDCDDGNGVDGDDCRNDCTLPYCGDGILDAGEDCDDGNNLDGDGCQADCTLCTGQIGDFLWNDGVVDEDCDGVQPQDGTLGMNGIDVRLIDPATENTLQTTTTGMGPGGMDGYYQFTALCAGNYKVEIDLPEGFVEAPVNVGDPATDSNANPAMVELLTDTDSDQTIDFGFCTEQMGGEGCTPGYWKNHSDAWLPTGYAQEMLVGAVWSEANTAFPDLADNTLSDALRFHGGRGSAGAARILLRAATASLLNSAHPDVDFSYAENDVIDDVNAALATQDRMTILAVATQLDDENNSGCPLGNTDPQALSGNMKRRVR